MAHRWKEDQYYLLDALDTYRIVIQGKELKDIRRLTLEFATNLHINTKELHHRSIQSINERLPYLDNLLAGALEIDNYAAKDQHLYRTRSRPDGCTEVNLCNTRHSYNGAIR